MEQQALSPSSTGTPEKIGTICSPYISANDPRVAGRPGTPPPDKCPHCGKLNYRNALGYGGNMWWQPFPAHCDCPKAVAQRKREEAERVVQEATAKQAQAAAAARKRIDRLLRNSGMGTRFQARTFEAFKETSDNAEVLKKAHEFVRKFEKLLPSAGYTGCNGMFITGEVGTGKTHIASAIANALIAQGKPVICMTMIDLLARIKSTYREEGTDEGEVLRLYKTVPLLIIDDIGKEPPTDWAISTIYNIINGRYEAMMPTIVTTNYDTAALIDRMTPPATKDRTTAAATVDRLTEMCRAIRIGGESWRSRKDRA